MSLVTDLTVSRSSRRSMLPSVVASVIFGTAAGAVGTLVVLAYLAPGLTPNVSFPVRNEAGILRASQISNVSFEGARRASVFLVATKPAAAPLDRANAPGEAISAGLVLTSDGWLLTTAPVDVRRPQDLTAIVDGRSYVVRRAVLDGYSGVTFLKVDAANLPVIAFASNDSVTPGDSLFAPDVAGGQIRLDVLARDMIPAETIDGLVRSSEKLQLAIRVSGDAPVGAMALNVGGDVVGIIGAKSQFGTRVIPSKEFSGVMSDVLRDGAAKRPVLGVNYLELSAARATSDLPNRGAQVTASADGRRPAVTRRGPAESSGIRQSDIITAVDGDPLTAANPLASAVARLAPGQTVTFTVLRGRLRTEIAVDVTFGSSVLP